MRDPRVLRSPTYRDGSGVRLADGQDWIMPAPPASDGPEQVATVLGEDYEALVMAVAEAIDESERRLAELCLAIYLLGRNYDLGPSDYQALLEHPAGDPALAKLQSALREIADAHIRGLARRAPSANPTAVHWQAVVVSPSTAAR